MRVKVKDNVYVRKPTSAELSEAQLYSSSVFKRVMSHAILRPKLEDYMREQGLWDDKKVDKLNDIITQIDQLTTELKKGSNGKFKKVSEGRKAAIDIRVLRAKQVQLLSETRRLDAYTVEGQAENARFDFLASKCIVNEENVPYFTSVDEYNEKADEDWVSEAALELSYILDTDLDRNWQSKLPENEFLLKYGLVNDKLHLVDKDGDLVDRDFNKLDVPIEDIAFAEFENDLE